MRPTNGNHHAPATLFFGIVLGGSVAAVLFLAAMYLFGTNAICAGGLLCDLAGYRNVGAARGIHLTGTADPHTSFAVVWESAHSQHPPVVQYRPSSTATPGGDWAAATGRSQSAAANGFVASSSFVHQVLVAGLQPGRRYQYRVSWDERSRDRGFSPMHETSTAPRNEPMRVAFIADICLEHRPDGLSGPIRAIRQHIADDDVGLILGGGDYACSLDDGRYPTAEPALQRFFDEWQPLFASTPLIAQYGNHECCHGEKPALWEPRLALSRVPERTPDGRSFAFDVLTAHIVGLYATGADDTIADGHVAWLGNTLQAARERGQQHLVVFQHAPLFGVGRTHPPDPSLRRQLVPVLEQQRLDLHLSAHDMSYERTAALTDAADGDPVTGDASAANRRGVVYAKVGAAGRTSANPDNVPADVPAHIVVAADDRFFYATLEIPAADDAPLRFTAYAVDTNGRRTVIDRFELAP